MPAHDTIEKKKEKCQLYIRLWTDTADKATHTHTERTETTMFQKKAGSHG
eukprot:m.238401 g.238401  ORF g.238401 m.238401 type:complete len:50 (+) comp48167_c0_seq1:21-170(+)